jgi:thiol-disulfide isomerase/thioredoxin
VLTFNDFEPHLHLQNDTTYLVNFWASWCTPCVEELPAFERVGENYRQQKVKVLLVSLDFPGQIETRLVPFLHSNEIRSEVLVLNDPDANKWINSVDPSWSGAIPATLIYRGKDRTFREGAYNYEELKRIIEQKINIK